MTLDISGLKPLDTTGLQPMDAAPTLDTSKLKQLDVSGLQPVEQGGFLDNAKSLVTTGLTALNRGMLSTGQMVNATRTRALMDAEEQARVRQADEANPTLRDVPVQQNLPATLDTGSYAEADRRRLAEAKPYDTTVSGRDPEEYAARVKANLADLARREVEIKKLPAPKVVQDALQSKTFGEFWTNFKKAPATIITSIGLESAPISLGIAGATAVGGATAGVPGAMATTGAVSYAVEYTASITDAMREEGVDFSDPASVEKALADDKMMARIEKRAAARAGPIAALDTATAGIASKVLIPARMAERLANSPVRRELTNLIPQMGAQSAGGAVGEAGAQLTSGQEWSPGAIAAEAVGELVTAPADVAAASLARGEAPRKLSPFEEMLGNPAPEAAGGLPTPEGLVPAQDIPPPPPAPVSSPEPQSGYETLYGQQPAPTAAAEEAPAPPSAVSTVLEELGQREGGKKSPLGKGLSEITAGQKGGQAAVDRVAGNETTTFKTAKGSTYAVQADGTTVRNKKLRNDPGHEGDQGVKPKTDKTVYIPSAEAARLSAPDSATWRVIDHGDGTLSLATQNADGRWGVSPDAKNVPVTNEPAVGLTPIELWGKDKVYKYDAFKTVHFGNEIVEVNKPQPRSIPVGEPVKITTPDDSAEIEARPVLVELDTLKPASGKLQPRDRSRVEMVQEAKERAVRLDPARLMPDRVSDAGAPIVTADGTVISGNGRMLSIAEVYSNPALRAQANAYKAALPAEAQGMQKPVLVMQSQLSGLDAERFAQQSNRPRIATLSATEQAETDAAVMGDMLGLYQGGDFESAGNAQFLKAFATNVVASSERNSFSKDGQLSAEGMRRMQGAILARAYGDSSLLSRMLESTDDNVRAIVGALQDAAPQIAALRAAVQSGQVMEGLDPLADINAAVTLISDMRKRRLSPAKFFRQMDAFTEVNPDVAGWVLSLYNPADPKTNTDAGEHALSRSQMAAVFRAFANEAMQHKTGGFFDDETTRSAILGAVGRNAAQGAALAEAPGVDASDGSGGAAGGQAQAGGRGPQASLADAETAASAGTQQGQIDQKARIDAKRRLKSGVEYVVPFETVYGVHDIIAPDMGMVPADVKVGVVEKIEPVADPKAKVGDEKVKVYLRLTTGQLGTITYRRDFILDAGAVYDPRLKVIFFTRLGTLPVGTAETSAFAKRIRGEIRHELLHVLRIAGIISEVEWRALVSHARNKLQILTYSVASFAQLTGKPITPTTSQGRLDTEYTNLYRANGISDAEIQENLDQEAVTHALELAYHGKLNARELAPLQGLIDKMELRMYGRGAKPVGTKAMASLAPTSSALDMSPEARKERAEAQGYDTSRVWYHGTQGSFDAFDLEKSGGSIHFAERPDLPAYYAYGGAALAGEGTKVLVGGPDWAKVKTLDEAVVRAYEDAQKTGDWAAWKKAKPLAEDARREAAGRSSVDKLLAGGSIIPAYVRIKNPLEITPRGEDYNNVKAINDAIATAKANGNDAIIVNHQSGGKQLVMLDPSNIRSTSAAFDPSESSSSRLLASLAPSSSPSLDPDDAGALRKARDSALEFLQDAQVRVRRLVERASEPLPDDADPYMAATLYHGRLGGRAEEAVGKAEAILRGANAIAKATNSPLENVKRLIDLYLVAKHAPERNAVHGDGSAGITNAEATAALSRIASLPQGAEIVAVADLVLDMNRRTLQTLLDGRVISQETFDLLSTTYANHVPLNRILPEGDEEIGAILAGGGFDVRGTGLQRARGSKLPIAPILENVLLNHEQAILRAEKNTVDLATLAFVRRFEDDLKGQITILGGKKDERDIDPAERAVRDQITALKKMLPKDDRPHHMERMPSKAINDPRVLELREDGERVLIRFRDPKLAAAFKATNSEKMPRALYPLMLYTRVMSQLATRFNPEFALPNKIRDIQETAVYIAAQKELGKKGAAKFLLREMRGENYKAIIDWLMGRDTPGARLYAEMISEGGTTGGLALSSRDRVRESIAEIEALITSNPGNIRQNLKRLGKAFDAFNKVFEDSTRLSAYRSAKARGLTKKRAAVHAKEASINFNRMGTAGPVINGLWMFSNASIQGTTKMIRAMRNPKVAATVALGMTAAVVAVGQWNDQWDEKWREKVTKWDRLNSLVVVLPSSTPEQFNYFVIPVSWGLKPLLNLSNYAYDAAEGIEWEWGDFLRDMTTATLEAANPVGGTTLTQALVPTALDTFVDVRANQSWSGSKIKPDPQRGVPEDVRYFSSLKDKASGRVSISGTEALVDTTGIAVSPADVNYVFEQLVGGVGRSAGRVWTTGAALLKGEVPDKDQFPFLARFYRRREGEEIGAGGQGLGVETRAVRELVEGQGRERVRLKYHLEGVVEELKTLPQDEIRKRIAAEVKKDPAALDVIKGLIEADVKGLTGLDRQINMLGVENGERASYYVKRLQEASPEERRSIVEDGVKKGLISRGVVEQMKVLGQLERLSPEQRKKFRDLASERGLRLPPE